jgi:hypothetical protein
MTQRSKLANLAALDGLRARVHASLARVPGGVGARLRTLNEALGRPLADADELADRRAFAAVVQAPPAAKGPKVQPASRGEPAPVVIFHLDKQRRDVARLTEILDASEIPYTVRSLEGDPAAQAATRRDSRGHRLPVVFIAGEVVGGRAELLNLGPAALKARVFPG